MPDDESGSPPGAVPVGPGKDTDAEGSKSSGIDVAFDNVSDGGGDVRGLVEVGLDTGDEPDSQGRDSLSVDFGDIFDDDDDVLPTVDAAAHELGFGASSGDVGELGVDLSPWPPLLGLLDSTEPEESPADGPFTRPKGSKGRTRSSCAPSRCSTTPSAAPSAPESSTAPRSAIATTTATSSPGATRSPSTGCSTNTPDTASWSSPTRWR